VVGWEKDWVRSVQVESRAADWRKDWVRSIQVGSRAVDWRKVWVREIAYLVGNEILVMDSHWCELKRD
jgi:hypothetical protein